MCEEKNVEAFIAHKEETLHFRGGLAQLSKGEAALPTEYWVFNDPGVCVTEKPA